MGNLQLVVRALVSFITAALTITGLMLGLSLLVAFAREQDVAALQTRAVKINAGAELSLFW